METRRRRHIRISPTALEYRTSALVFLLICHWTTGNGNKTRLKIDDFWNGSVTGCYMNDAYGREIKCHGFSTIPLNIADSEKIVSLDMSSWGNEITVLKKRALARANLLALDILCLRNCKIRIIQPGAFDQGTNLTHLDLSRNNVEYLDPVVFIELIRLEDLNLKYNPIIRFQQNSPFPPLVHLRSLDLGYCQLEEIPLGAFRNLLDLRNLYLNDNNLKTLSWRVLHDLALTLEYVDLSENPWHCDCHVKFLIDTLSNIIWLPVRLSILKSAYCRSAPRHACAEYLIGLNWYSILQPQNLVCPAIINNFLKKDKLYYHAVGNGESELVQEVTLECEFEGFPEPQMTWLINDQIVSELDFHQANDSDTKVLDLDNVRTSSSSAASNVFGSTIEPQDGLREKHETNSMDKWSIQFKKTLLVRSVKKHDQRKYACLLRGPCGVLEKHAHALHEEKPAQEPSKIYHNGGGGDGKSANHTYLILTLVAALIFVLAAFLSFLYKWRQHLNRQNQLTCEEIREFRNGLCDDKLELLNRDDYRVVVPAAKLPYKKSLEISLNKLEILRDQVLGKGQFGIVYKAKIKNSKNTTEVALKMLKNDSPTTALKGFLSEIKILTYLGTHPNIVPIVGAYTAEMAQGIVYIATELCPLGSLDKHLREVQNRVMGINHIRHWDTQYENTANNHHLIPYKDLIRWSHQIACGMEYLGEKNVVYMDLAPRNVLLSSDGTAKLSDFGLSRGLDKYQIFYKKQNPELLPWRSMAPESLKCMYFSSQSDVWSYGVTLWEIYSLGEIPYADHHWSLAFVESLENGLRLKQPFGGEVLHGIMSDCWKKQPAERPTFAQLKHRTGLLLGAYLV